MPGERVASLHQMRLGIMAPTAVHSSKKVVGYFLGLIPSRKNLKEWAYLSGKTGRLI
jgi:hypothetical protein